MDKGAFESERARIFSSLFEISWKGKEVWEHIRDGSLAATPAFEGELYQKANTKLLFVGRDLNGWDSPLGNCSTLQDTVAAVMGQRGALDTLVDARGFGDGPRKYRHKNYAFFRFIKHVLEYLGESDFDLDKTWYCDTKRWNQRFVWANLYCIAPRNPEKTAHPDPAMVKLGMNSYVDLMKLYIHYYRPDAVVFITDIYGWFVRWRRMRSFRDIVNNYQENASDGFIAATGNVEATPIYVCKRPDRRGNTHEQVREMAEILAEQIKKNKE